MSRPGKILLLLLPLTLTGIWLARCSAAPEDADLRIAPQPPAPHSSFPSETTSATIASADQPTADEGTSLADGWYDYIRTSQLPEHRRAAALLETDPQIKRVRLQRLLQETPDDPLLKMQLADLCLQQRQAEACDGQLYEQLALFDGDNGTIRDYRVLLAWQERDEASSLQELQEGARSHYSDDLWAGQLQILGDSLTAFGMEERNQAWFEAVSGYAAALPNNSGWELLQLCRAQQFDNDWQDACRARGLNLTDSGRSLMQRLLGLSLASAVSEPQDPEVAASRAQLQEIQQYISEGLADPAWQSAGGRAAVINDTQWQVFLDILASEGEVAAIEYLRGVLAEQQSNG